MTLCYAWKAWKIGWVGLVGRRTDVVDACPLARSMLGKVGGYDLFMVSSPRTRDMTSANLIRRSFKVVAVMLQAIARRRYAMALVAYVLWTIAHVLWTITHVRFIAEHVLCTPDHVLGT